ncbi:MAG TPA: DUF2269 family protein [Gaiellaceae bacterium]
MSTLQWLLALHVTGAFLFLGGSVFAAIFSVLALRGKRPSEVALFLGLTRVAVVAVVAGLVLALVVGLWLVHEAGYAYERPWIVASLVLLVAAGALGKIGGERDGKTRKLAVRLAAEGDGPSTELSARLRDPVTMALSWGAGACSIVILALMIWKPGG